MKVELKTWGTLGLATALAGAGLAGCADDAGENGEGAETEQAGEMGEGEGGEGEGGEGEGGESGEGGVSIADAGSDPVVYGSALAVAEAHAIAAKDAFAVGKKNAAAEMFSHPVSEVLVDMEPIFAERGVDDFKELFMNAAVAASEGGETEVGAAYDAIIAALKAAGEKAPESDASAAAVAAGIAADQIGRAVTMYQQAGESDQYAPYLDGYGFALAAKAAFAGSADEIKAENADLAASISAALELLGKAYPTAERPAELSVDAGELLAAGSKVELNQ